MKNTETRTKRIHVRLTNDEYNIIKSKAKEANTDVSSYIRTTVLNSKVQPLINGTDVARAINKLHFGTQNFRNDITVSIDKLTKAINENSKFIDKNPIFNNTEFLETAYFQRARIGTLIQEVHDSCEKSERIIQDKVHALYENFI